MSGTLLYLMRHGAPTLTGRLLGATDCPATPEGIAACVDQATTLDVDHLVCSDLVRARVCAGAIGPPVVDPRWRELDFGAWDGLPPAAVDAAALGRFWDDPDACPPPGGERWSALVARVDAALAALPPAPALVVTHGGPMRAALHLLCGLSLAQAFAFDLPYACVLGLRLWPGARPNAQVIGLWP